MRRNPLYVFKDLSSIGIYNVPLNSTVQINDIDGDQTPTIIQVIAKDNIGPGSTVGDFLLQDDNYTRPGSAGFVAKTDKGMPGGVAPLNEDATIDSRYLPSVVIGQVFTAESEQEMIDLNAVEGDLCIRTDISSTYMRNSAMTGTATDWTELLMNIGGVQSVNSYTGTVNLLSDDIPEGITNKYFSDSLFDSKLRSRSIDELIDVNTLANSPQSGEVLTWDGSTWAPRAVSHPITTVAGRTGNVVLNTDDVAEASNLYYKESYVSAYIATLTDDSAGIGDTQNLYSADKIATDMSFKANTDNTVLRGEVNIGEDSMDMAQIVIQKSDSTMKGISTQTEFKFKHSLNAREFGMFYNVGEIRVDLNANNTTAMSFSEGKAPQTTYQPQGPDELTRKDYVDTAVSSITTADNDFSGKNTFTDGLDINGGLFVIGDVHTDSGLSTPDGDNLISYDRVIAASYPAAIGDTIVKIADVPSGQNHWVNIKGTVFEPLVIKNDSAVQAWDDTYTNKMNLVSRTNGTDYDNEVIVGDNGVVTAIRAIDGFDAVVRKGAYGSTEDFKIITEENMPVAAAVADIPTGLNDPGTNEAKINELLASLRAAGLLAV